EEVQVTQNLLFSSCTQGTDPLAENGSPMLRYGRISSLLRKIYRTGKVTGIGITGINRRTAGMNKRYRRIEKLFEFESEELHKVGFHMLKNGPSDRVKPFVGNFELKQSARAAHLPDTIQMRFDAAIPTYLFIYECMIHGLDERLIAVRPVGLEKIKIKMPVSVATTCRHFERIPPRFVIHDPHLATDPIHPIDDSPEPDCFRKPVHLNRKLQ